MTEIVEPSENILSLSDAVKWREALSLQKKRLVVTNGCFDILHRGHISYLCQAHSLGDELLVLINSDASVKALKGPTRPLVSEADRAYALSALKPVSRVVVFDSPRCDRELTVLRPDVYVKAGDYTIQSLDDSERAALENCGAEIVFVPFVQGFSTTELVNRINAQNV